jgi:hypothetical protein
MTWWKRRWAREEKELFGEEGEGTLEWGKPLESSETLKEGGV